MRYFTLSMIVFLLLSLQLMAVEGPKHRNHAVLHCFDDIEVELENGSIILKNKDYRHSQVEITRDYELYVNGDRVETNAAQQELIEDYYHCFTDLLESATDVGIEGAKIGVAGAKVGIKAIARLFKLISPDYDIEDYEQEIEQDAEQLEEKAEEIEGIAEELEEAAEDLEQLHVELRERIPALEELSWF